MIAGIIPRSSIGNIHINMKIPLMLHNKDTTTQSSCTGWCHKATKSKLLPQSDFFAKGEADSRFINLKGLKGNLKIDKSFNARFNKAKSNTLLSRQKDRLLY